MLPFFFSSRRRHTRSTRDWSSDVCSSDLDDEGAFARRVADRFSSEHHVHSASDAEFIAALPHWVELNDDLVADASSLPLYSVSRLARERGCIVLLSGEGSDELFGGYGSYHKFVALRALGSLVPSTRLRGALARALE